MKIRAQWPRFFLSLALALLLSARYLVSDAHATEPWPNDPDFLVGVAAHPSLGAPTWWSGYGGSDADIEMQIHLAAEMGSKIYRIDAQIVTADIIEKVITLCRRYGMEVMPILDSESSAEILAKQFRGRVKYYQVKNEMNVAAHKSIWLDGTRISDFKMSTDIPRPKDEECLDLLIADTVRIIKRIRAEDPDVEILINGTWTHYGFLDYAFARFSEEGVDIDLIGWDWYSDMEDNRAGHSSTIDGLNSVAKYLHDHYGQKDILICEYNMWVPSFDRAVFTGVQHVTQCPGNGNGKIDPFEEENLNTQTGPYLVNNIQYLYSNRAANHIKGLMVYELIEEPGQSNPFEAKFGLTYAKMLDPDQRLYQLLGPKPQYYEVQRLLGGGSVPIERLSPSAPAPEYTIAASATDEAPDCAVMSSQAGGTAAGGGVYLESATVTLTAAANPGYGFLGWYRGGTNISKNPVYQFTAVEDANNPDSTSSSGKFLYEARFTLADGCATCSSEGACISVECGESELCGESRACTCATGFAGAGCDQCASGYSGYPSCVQPPDAGVDAEGADSGASGAGADSGASGGSGEHESGLAGGAGGCGCTSAESAPLVGLGAALMLVLIAPWLRHRRQTSAMD